MQGSGESGVITPEAVRLEFEDASVGSRAVAITIDWLTQLAALLLLVFAGSLLLQQVGPGLPPWVTFTLLALLSFLVLFGYPIGFETLLRGKTPGKAALGLRVVTIEGAPVGFRHAAVRAALGLVEFMMTSGFVAVITALVSERGQRVGDHLAGTVVVRERTGAGRAEATTFAVPQGYEGYAATIDPAGLRAEDYQAVRAFLLRASDLPAERRATLGQRLAAGVAGRVAHEIPQGVHPEAFLLCVAARYQGRGSGPGAQAGSGAAWPSTTQGASGGRDGQAAPADLGAGAGQPAAEGERAGHPAAEGERAGHPAAEGEGARQPAADEGRAPESPRPDGGRFAPPG